MIAGSTLQGVHIVLLSPSFWEPDDDVMEHVTRALADEFDVSVQFVLAANLHPDDMSIHMQVMGIFDSETPDYREVTRVQEKAREARKIIIDHMRGKYPEIDQMVAEGRLMEAPTNVPLN